MHQDPAEKYAEHVTCVAEIPLGARISGQDVVVIAECQGCCESTYLAIDTPALETVQAACRSDAGWPVV